MLPPLVRLALWCLLLLHSFSAAVGSPRPSTTPADAIPGQPPPPSRLTLNDAPIVADSYASLDGDWSLSSPAIPSPITGRVPGDLISDLVRARLLPEPVFENNFLVNAQLWNNHSWTYSTNFSLSSERVARLQDAQAASDVWLVFDGIKMGANISVNGQQLGQSRSQFLRLQLSLRSIASSLRAGANVLEVQFDPHISVHGLFMQCTGGWDWAPVSQSTTLDDTHLGTYSRGIWKSVYTIDVSWLALTHLTAHSTYQGPFPTQRLSPHRHGPFSLNVTAHVYAPAATSLTYALIGNWAEGTQLTSATVNVPAGASTLSAVVAVPASAIELWWPNGFGAPFMYRVGVSLAGATGGLQASRRIGFRVFSVVTGNDTDPAWVAANADANGSEQMGLRYRVNGEPIFSRGANMIPMDELEGRYTAEGHQRAVLSAAEAGMNLLRVWAGGVWLPDVFYDTADEAGVMVYHDMVNRWNYDRRPEETAAYQHQIRRLSSHPALVVYSGCNECFPLQGGGIVPDLLSLIASEDASRPVWPACPAQGFTSGVHRLTGLPNGAKLAMYSDQRWGPLDTHGPYQHGDGFPAVNGDPRNLNLFDPMTPPTFNASTPIGLQYNHTFTSEFGAVTWSSFESVSTVFAPEHWSLHGGSPPDNCTNGFCSGDNVIAQRNYPCDSLVLTYWGGEQSQLDAVGEAALKEQLYKCLTASALIIKGYIEQHRATNTFGLMLWQLNEIWPTGGWGSLEWSSGEYPGQVLGGRWKPSHHWLLQYLYTDVQVACGRSVERQQGDVLCYAKLDGARGAGAHIVTATVVQLADARNNATVSRQVVLPAGPGSIAWFTLPGSLFNASVVTLLAVHDSAHLEVSRNFFLSTTPAALALTPISADAVEVSVGPASDQDGSVPVHVVKKSHAVLLWATLTTLHPGRFSVNAFLATELDTLIRFHPWGPVNATLLSASLRLEHANLYAHPKRTAANQHSTARRSASE